MIALILCNHSNAPSTCISASAICHLWRFGLATWCIGRPNCRFPLAALVAYPVILSPTLLHRGYSQ